MKTLDTPRSVTINAEQRLYVIPCGSGYTCLGFDVCERRASALKLELQTLGYDEEPATTPGTVARYAQYQSMQNRARNHYERTGYRFRCELEPLLMGLEGRRVEATRADGERVRFKVGKSTGWIPCHLALHNSRSSGGMAISPGEFTSFQIIK